MAIQKRFIHFKKFSDFNSKKLSANEANTQYTVGVSGAIQNGEPDILYQSYVWIKDTQQQWTHGQLYNGIDSPIVKGDADNSAVLKGGNNVASSSNSSAFGLETNASGEASHAEGHNTIAEGNSSHAEGLGTIASGPNSHAEGKYNKSNDNTIHSVGIGADNDHRKNAHEIMDDGKHYIYGVGGYDGTNPDTSYDLATYLPNMVNITYDELVALRSDSKLVPGQQYRITDYVTTTTQENTQSAGHQFDIIVTADNKNTLSEIARACKTEFDLEKYKDAFSGSWAEHMSYVGIYEYEGKEYHLYESDSQDLQMLMDFNNSIVLDEYPEAEYPYTCYPTYCRQKYESWGEWIIGQDFAENIAFKYNLAEDTYFFSSNLEAWQIWYCLDNDTECFAWATNPIYNLYGSKMIMTIENDTTWIYIYNGYNSIKNKHEWYWNPNTENLGFKNNIDDSGNGSKFLYTDTEFPSVGETAVLWTTASDTYTNVLIKDVSFKEGKGVIYRMIDEFNNDCPYDFKNIQFYRGVYDRGGIAPDGEEDMNFYLFTFSFRTENNEIIDTSIFGNNGRLLNDEGQISGVCSNVIGQYMDYDASIDSPTKPTQRLNDIVFYSHYNFEGETYYGCYSNIFGNDCFSNSFGNDCFSNIFGNDCHHNSFGNRCRYNSFGNNCCFNNFRDDCYSNSFANVCSYNSFYNNCYGNNFDNDCQSNGFDNDCHSNNFGNNCHYNSFGNSCYYNSFGNGCNYNSFNEKCAKNIFGNDCYENSFGDVFYSNSFGNKCFSNIFDYDCTYNNLGNGCTYNSFGEGCRYNIFGNNCGQNSFGNHCSYNSFGNGCYFNSFRFSASKASSLKDFCNFNHFDDGCLYNVIWSSVTTSSNVLLKNINVNRGVSGTSNSYNYINIDTLNSKKEININNYNGHIYIDYGDIFKVTYSELWLLRENAQLIPGRQYRITDYNTTTSQENTRSAEHKFDIIVTAIDEYRLSEEAQAIQNFNDSYFDDSNLSAWKIWYSLDNDVDKFTWARNERIETDIVEGIDSSNCTISVGYSYDDEEGLNKFDNRVPFISQIWNDPNDEVYLEGSAIDELISHWGYETDPYGIENCLTLYGLNLLFDEETGEITSEDGISSDRWFYRGIITVDNTDYDYWEKAEEGGDNGELCYMDQSQQFSEKLFFLTDRIVSGEPIITTTTVKTVIPLEPKGVIYRMIDEWGNDCPYDFKNIMFKRYELEAPDPIENKPYIAQLSTNIINQFNEGILSYIWSGVTNNTKHWEEDYAILNSSPTGNTKFFYTFSNVIDDIVSDKSLTDKCLSNTIKKCGTYQHTLNDIVFFNTNIGSSCKFNSFGDNCRLNSFGDNCHHNSFGSYCDSNIVGNSYRHNSFGNVWYLNSFGNDCHNNSFGNSCECNSFGNDCYNNSFSDNCRRNSFGNDCCVNLFGNDCCDNTFGNDCCVNLFDIGCYDNTFDYDCSNNNFGHYCNHNSFGHGCYDNTFGNNCCVNLFGNDCHLNTFGNGCESNSFRASGDDTSSHKSYCYYNHFDDGCSYNIIWNATTTSSSYKLQNININRGTSGTSSSYNIINIDTLNQDYEIQVAKNSKGEIKIYCEADLIA